MGWRKTGKCICIVSHWIPAVNLTAYSALGSLRSALERLREILSRIIKGVKVLGLLQIWAAPFPFVPLLPSLLTALQLLRNQGLTFFCSPDLICFAWLLSSFVLNVTWLSLLVSSCQSYCKRLLRCPSFSLEDRGEQKRNGEQKGVKGQLLR